MSCDVDPNNISASMNDGVLELTIKKPGKSESRKIDIAVQ